MNKNLAILIAIIVISGGIFFTRLWLNQPPQIISSSPVTQTSMSPVMKSTISAWLPSWDEASVLNSFKNASQNLNEILPAWYKLEPDGTLKELAVKYKKEVLNIAASSNVLVTPSIGNDFDGARVHKLLNNKQLSQKLISDLTNIATSASFHGWDLDWEEILPDDKENFNGFVSQLASQLHHNNLILSITVHAQTGENNQWIGTKGQDYLNLSRSADFIRVMAYDFHSENSTPGPITPLEDLRSSINYAQKNIPPQKIIIGLPNYGYDWDSKKGVGSTYTELIGKAQTYHINPTRDKDSGELNFSYIDPQNNTHSVWFQDQTSIFKKISLAKSLGINSFVFWKLGGEDLTMWNPKGL